MIGLRATDVVSLNGSPTVSPTTVAACSGVPFSLQIDLDELLGVVPRAAGVGHVDRLEQAEHGDRDQVGDEEVRVEEREGQREAEDHDEDVPHARLGVLRADPDDRLRVLDVAASRSRPMFFLMNSTAR